ncbi:MAG: YlcI/YnfO family protein [Caldilineaceae bacterium]
MTTLSLRLPDSLHQGLKEAVLQDGVSLNQFIVVAIAEKLSAMLTEKYLVERAAKGNHADYLAALAQVPDVEPEAYDRLPSTSIE